MEFQHGKMIRLRRENDFPLAKWNYYHERIILAKENYNLQGGDEMVSNWQTSLCNLASGLVQVVTNWEKWCCKLVEVIVQDGEVDLAIS